MASAAADDPDRPIRYHPNLGVYLVLGSMAKLIAILVIVLLLASCRQEIQNEHPMMSLTETDEAGTVVRELRFELTDQPAKTCLVGDWKVASALVDASSYTHNSAYAWRDGNLEILLVNRFCDSYDSYVGRIEGGSFVGEHVLYGRGSGPMIEGSTVGRVSGLYSEP